MLFNTTAFFLFLGIFLIAIRLIPRKRHFSLLLGGSLFFYSFAGIHVVLLLILTAFINFTAANNFGPGKRFNKQILALTVITNMGFLAFFKYFESGLDFLRWYIDNPDLLSSIKILLPVGISFYTFQLTAYIVDVYNNRIPPIKEFPWLLLFTCYFPQLVAGPIERTEVLLPRLKTAGTGNADSMSRGALLLIIGLFKKIFIADNISQYVDYALHPNGPVPASGYTFPGVVFALQIYADFSGYTDMARGISFLFGVPLSENFRLPFFASNPSEIWRRWHITLMSFLRDYIYIPLGGSTMGTLRRLSNVMIVFTLGGIWHGAGTGYLLWGVYSGLWVVGYSILRPHIRKISSTAVMHRVVTFSGILLTFLSFSWGTLIIRSHSIAELSRIAAHLFPDSLRLPVPPAGIDILFFVWPLIAMDLIKQFSGKEDIYDSTSPLQRSAIAALMIGAILYAGSFGAEQFFYFRF